MKTITSIPHYCKEINIPSPKHPFFDVRKFEDNAKTVNLKQYELLATKDNNTITKIFDENIKWNQMKGSP